MIKATINRADLLNKINFLVQNNHDIVHVLDDNDEYFYVCSAFEPPSINTLGSNPFIQFKGVEISEFLSSSVYNVANLMHFKDLIAAFITKDKEMFHKMSDKLKWVFYTRP